jgi:hypothetical protein
MTNRQFYKALVSIPDDPTRTPIEILDNPKFYPFFKDAIGAIDGTHIIANPSAQD